MFAQVWQKVVKGQYHSSVATLNGYRRLAVRGEDYPVIKPANNVQVTGLVYYNVTRPDLAKLDTFEGSYYIRQKVSVVVDGKLIQADAYLLKPRFYPIATHHPWDEKAFANRGIKRFLTRYRGFSG